MKIQDVVILVVDDVNALRVQIRDLLKRVGFERVLVAGNGFDAKKVLQTEKIHLILSDWHMMPVDGMELLEYVRENPDCNHIPFVMLTAENTKERVVEAIQSGVDDFLIKPLTVEQIQNKVFKVIMEKKVLL